MSSSLDTLLRIIRLGYNNFWRNRWLTLGATLLMTLTLTMISVSLLFSFVVRDTAEMIRSKIDLTIYFRDDSLPDERIEALASEIAKQPSVIGVDFTSKQEALEIWKRLPINENIKKPVTAENNPLPRSILVDTENPDDIQTLVTQIEAVDTDGLICNECVSYSRNRDTVDRLVSLTRFIQRTGIFLSIFFGIIAIFNVFNIIRITILARSDEIEIMRYVGASNSFVRGPFVVEGILYGVLGTILTSGILLLIGHILNPYINIVFSMFNLGFYQYVLAHLPILILAQLGVGVLLGVAVSMLSMRRYLKA